ncbi:MAG: hypothetical protein ACOYI8_02840 [Christensenellales bacterium]
MERKKRRSGFAAPAVLIVALLCLLAWFLAKRIVSGGSGTLRTAIELPAKSMYHTETLGDGVLYNDGATLHALNNRGRQIWSFSAGTGADFSVGAGGVATWAGNLITLLGASNGSTLYSSRIEGGSIRSAYLGEIYAAIQIGEERASSIVLLDVGGSKRIDVIDMSKKTVLDFGFFSGGTLFWIMTLDTEGTIPTCSVYTYRPGKTIAGTITDSQQVLYEVLFQSSHVRVVGTTHIKDYDYAGREIVDDRILVYGWYLMGIDDAAENPLMVFAPNEAALSGKGVQDIRIIHGQVDRAVRLPYPATKLLPCGDAVYAFNNQFVMVCRPGSATPERYALPMYVDSVLGLTDDHRAIVTYNGSVYIVPLP